MPLRDPASISPAIFSPNTEGLSLMKTFGADLAKMEAAQGKAKDAYMKMFSKKYDIPWNIDLTQGIKECF